MNQNFTDKPGTKKNSRPGEEVGCSLGQGPNSLIKPLLK